MQTDLKIFLARDLRLVAPNMNDGNRLVTSSNLHLVGNPMRVPGYKKAFYHYKQQTSYRPPTTPIYELLITLEGFSS